MEFKKYKVLDVVRVLNKTVNPQKSKDDDFVVYSLPAFDNNKTPENLKGREINSNKILLDEKCILFNKLNLRFKRVWQYNNILVNGICSTEYIPLVCDEEKVDFDFLYYYVINNTFYFNLLGNASGTSNSHQRIHKEDLLDKEILIPNLENQKKISRILGSIDRKIELNKKINVKLYEFAINYLKEKTLSDEVIVSKFAKIQGGYAFKSKDLIDIYTKNRIIKIKNLRSEINADVINSQFAEDEVVEKIDNKFKLSKGDVAIAMTGAELGKTGFIYGDDNYYLNQRVGVIRGRDKASELYLNILFLSDNFQKILNSKGYGSAQPNISTSDIESILINDINEYDLNEFYVKIRPIYEKIISNSEEILNLEQLRDTLLPKLMNGEIDLEKIVI